MGSSEKSSNALLGLLLPVSIGLIATFAGIAMLGNKESSPSNLQPRTEERAGLGPNGPSKSYPQVVNPGNTTSAQSLISKDEIIDYMVRYTYRKSCLMAGNVSEEIKNMSMEDCIRFLTITKGPALRDKVSSFSESDLRALYFEYKYDLN